MVVLPLRPQTIQQGDPPAAVAGVAVLELNYDTRTWRTLWKKGPQPQLQMVAQPAAV